MLIHFLSFGKGGSKAARGTIRPSAVLVSFSPFSEQRQLYELAESTNGITEFFCVAGMLGPRRGIFALLIFLSLSSGIQFLNCHCDTHNEEAQPKETRPLLIVFSCVLQRENKKATESRRSP